MTVVMSTIGFRAACFGQFHLALILLLRDCGNSQQPQPTSYGSSSPSVYFSGPVCPTGCSSCSKLNGCATCRSNYVLLVHWHAIRQVGSCVRACPSGYFVANTTKGFKCMKCDSSRCEVCSNSTNCTRCYPPFALHHGQCLVACPNEQPYFVERSRQCAKHLNCEVGPWSAWTECRRNGVPVCGSKRGKQKRQRSIIQQPTTRGQQCPATIEFRKCRKKFKNCEDSPVFDNSSGHAVLQSHNRSSVRNWLQLALETRQRKLHQRPSKTAAPENGDGRRRHSVPPPLQPRQSSHRRRIDVNSIEAHDI